MRARSADELSDSICATIIHVELPQSRAPSEQAHELHAHEREAAALHLPQPSLQSEGEPAERSAWLSRVKTALRSGPSGAKGWSSFSVIWSGFAP